MKAIVNNGIVHAVTAGMVVRTDTAIITEDCGDFTCANLDDFLLVNIPDSIERIPEAGDSYADGVFTEAIAKQKARWQEQADAIQAKIDVIEKDTILNRGSRELERLTMESIIAPQIASLKHVTPAQVLAASVYYQKLKALDEQVINLRTEMAALWALINS